MEKSEQSDGMANFNAALRQVMQVSKADLTKILAQEKATNSHRTKRGPKPIASSGH